MVRKAHFLIALVKNQLKDTKNTGDKLCVKNYAVMPTIILCRSTLASNVTPVWLEDLWCGLHNLLIDGLGGYRGGGDICYGQQSLLDGDSGWGVGAWTGCWVEEFSAISRLLTWLAG